MSCESAEERYRPYWRVESVCGEIVFIIVVVVVDFHNNGH